MSSSIGAPIGDSSTQRILATDAKLAAAGAKQAAAVQESSALSLQAQEESPTSVPFQMTRVQKTLGERIQYTKTGKVKEEGEEKAVEGVAAKGEEAGEAFKDTPQQQEAKKFEKRNPQVKANVLVELREAFKPGLNKDQIIALILDRYPQADLALEALRYLMQTATDPKEKATLRETLTSFISDHGKDIAKGKEIARLVGAAGIEGVDEASIRKLHQEMTHESPKDFAQTWADLSAKYPGKTLEQVLKLLVGTVGKELNHAIDEKGKLHNVMHEVKFLQAALGPDKFFKKHMGRLTSQMRDLELTLPPQLTSSEMTREILKLALADYPNAARVLQIANALLEGMGGL